MKSLTTVWKIDKNQKLIKTLVQTIHNNVYGETIPQAQQVTVFQTWNITENLLIQRPDKGE
jgi:hypothetical protein